MNDSNALAIKIREFVSARKDSPTCYTEDGQNLVLSCSLASSGYYWTDVHYKGKHVFDFTQGHCREYISGEWEKRLHELARHTIVRKLIG